MQLTCATDAGCREGFRCAACAGRPAAVRHKHQPVPAAHLRRRRRLQLGPRRLPRRPLRSRAVPQQRRLQRLLRRRSVLERAGLVLRLDPAAAAVTAPEAAPPLA